MEFKIFPFTSTLMPLFNLYKVDTEKNNIYMNKTIFYSHLLQQREPHGRSHAPPFEGLQLYSHELPLSCKREVVGAQEDLTKSRALKAWSAVSKNVR